MKRAFPSKWHRWLFHARQYVWPSMGWKRLLHLMFLRLSRMQGGETSMARGFACGAAASMTPLIGLHFITAALIAIFVRGNWIAALVGTSLGNPWTFPFIWGGSYEIGVLVMSDITTDQGASLRQLSWRTLVEDPFDILLPMLIGSIPLIIIIAPLSYFTVLIVLRGYRIHRGKQRLKRAAKRAACKNAAENTSDNLLDKTGS